MAKTIAEMQHEVYVNNVQHGWYDRPRTFADDVALLHSEVSEMYEAHRKGHVASIPTQDEMDKDEDLAPYPASYDPSSVHAEAADIFIRILDTCERYDIDLVEEYERKMKFNGKREYRHGNKVV